MINFITIINIDTPTWPLPTNTNVPKHTQNSFGILVCPLFVNLSIIVEITIKLTNKIKYGIAYL